MNPQFWKPLFLALFLSACTGNSADLPRAERRLLAMERLTTFYDYKDLETLAEQVKDFGDAFRRLLEANPATMTYPFQALRDSGYICIAQSADSNARLYYWDDETGGNGCRFFVNIFQYKGKIIDIEQYNEDTEYCLGCLDNQRIYVPLTTGSALPDSLLIYQVKGDSLEFLGIEKK